jgi:hypothetical protein
MMPPVPGDAITELWEALACLPQSFHASIESMAAGDTGLFRCGGNTWTKTH